MTEVIKSADFLNVAGEAGKTVLVDVYADWCGPCKAIAPVIDKLAVELAGTVRIVKVDRDEAASHGDDNNPVLEFLSENGIRGIPALLLFEDGAYKGALMGGPRPRSNIVEWIETTLGRPVTPQAPAASGPSAPQP